MIVVASPAYRELKRNQPHMERIKGVFLLSNVILTLQSCHKEDVGKLFLLSFCLVAINSFFKGSSVVSFVFLYVFNSVTHKKLTFF